MSLGFVEKDNALTSISISPGTDQKSVLSAQSVSAAKTKTIESIAGIVHTDTLVAPEIAIGNLTVNQNAAENIQTDSTYSSSSVFVGRQIQVNEFFSLSVGLSGQVWASSDSSGLGNWVDYPQPLSPPVILVETETTFFSNDLQFPARAIFFLRFTTSGLDNTFLVKLYPERPIWWTVIGGTVNPSGSVTFSANVEEYTPHASYLMYTSTTPSINYDEGPDLTEFDIATNFTGGINVDIVTTAEKAVFNGIIFLDP